LPHGASLIGATISYSCSATPTTGTLLFEVDDGGVNTVSNSANLNSSPGPGTVSISPSINVYRSGTESWLKANISINHGSNMLVYITGIEVSYRF
jgi:hypothetical protein